MDFVKQYLKIISYVCSGLVFAFASFYILANLYHYYELRKDYIVDFNNHELVMDLTEKLNTVSSNLTSFDTKAYNGKISTSNMLMIKQKLSNCVDAFKNPTISNLRGKSKITIIDVYNLRESYDNDILNKCIIGNLYFLTEIDDTFGSQYLVDNVDLTKLYFGSLSGYTSYLKKDLLNNSSYYYNTAIASSSMKDNTRDGFNEVMDAYNKAADFVLYVSDWYKMEVGG